MEVTKAMLTSSPKSHRLKVLLQIMYLRTYHNAGTAEVLLDGQRVAVLDALHPNFVQFFYIIEEQLTLHLEVQQVPSQKTLSGGGKDLPLSVCMIRQARGPAQKVMIASVMLCVAATRVDHGSLNILANVGTTSAMVYPSEVTSLLSSLSTKLLESFTDTNMLQ